MGVQCTQLMFSDNPHDPTNAEAIAEDLSLIEKQTAKISELRSLLLDITQVGVDSGGGALL